MDILFTMLALCGAAALLSLVIYLVPLILLSCCSCQDLRAKYGNWAVVTGASSGIGLAIARKLASQGINICLVALDDEFLEAAVSALRKTYPAQVFRAVGVDLASNPEAYVRTIADATRDLQVSILINNAGYLVMGYFDEVAAETHAKNFECNVLAAIRLSHLIYSRMIAQKRRGCIAMISSSSWFIPAPYATIYGASKAALSNFAVSLSIEAKNHNVDVCVIHPSYTHTNLYRKNPKLGILSLLEKFGWSPDDVAEVFACSVGRVIVRDAGLYSIATYILGRAIDAGTLARLIIPFRKTMAPPPRNA